MRELNYKQALSKAMAICSRSEKCINDIEKKLQNWNISSSDSEKIIDELIEQEFIDEQRFAEFYVRDKFRFNYWGKIKIRYMLSGKGIPSNLINQAITGQIEEEDYLNTAIELLSQKARKIHAEDDFEMRAKLTRFAQGRGFEFEIINRALTQISENN